MPVLKVDSFWHSQVTYVPVQSTIVLGVLQPASRVTEAWSSPIHLWHAAGCLGQSPDESEAEGADRIVVAQLVQQQCEKGIAC